jgi:hypothetical protein
VTVNSTDRYNSYVVTAVPQTVGKTGDRGFCSDQSGAIKFDPAGASNCTSPSANEASPPCGIVLLAADSFYPSPSQPSGRAPKALNAHDLAQRVDRHYNRFIPSPPDSPRATRAWASTAPRAASSCCSKPGRMKWDYSNPAGKLFLLDGKYAWFYARGDSQVQRIPAKELDDLRSPLRFLLGHTELEKEMNGLTLAPAANSQFTLSGVPKGQENRVTRLTLTVTPPKEPSPPSKSKRPTAR